ncbi:hypothetical protein HDU86_003989 [Geranomyces michiganensis]|nr:hypothetical protein HDU86_003989 [Geranomyces michiganensis]
MRAQRHAPSQAYVLALTACAQVGDAETASRLLQLAEQAGIALPRAEAGLLLLRAAAKGPQPMKSLIRHLPTSERLMGDGVQSAAASALFVARTLLLLGGTDRAVKAQAILDGMVGSDDAQVDTVHRSLRILAAGTLRDADLLHSLLSTGRSHTGDSHHLSCCVIALARCDDSRSQSLHAHIVRAQADLLGSLDSQMLDQDLDLILAASELAFESCVRHCSLADASKLRKLGQHISGPLTSSLHRAKLLDALDVGFLRVAKAALEEDTSLSSTQRRELHHTWMLVAEGLRYRGGLRNPTSCSLILELHILAAASGLSSMQVAMELFEHAKRDGLIPEPEVYHILMKGWASSPAPRADRVDHVMRTFRAMHRAGHVPDADAHAHLFTAATPTAQDIAPTIDSPPAKSQEIKSIPDLLELEIHMLSAGIPHSESSASALILALVRSGLYEDAFQRLVDMRLAGLERSTALYNHIFEACQGDSRASTYVLADLRFSMAREDPATVKADARTCRALIACCAAVGDAAAAMAVLRDLRTLQAPTREDYARVAQILDAAGALADADRLVLEQWQL